MEIAYVYCECNITSFEGLHLLSVKHCIDGKKTVLTIITDVFYI